MVKGKAKILSDQCVACGCCLKVCPKDAIHIIDGAYAAVDFDKCIGCGLCKKTCPASIVEIEVLS